MHHQRVRRVADHADRREILAGIVAGILVKRGADRQRAGVAQQQRIAVGTLLATALVPTVPPAPGRLSITTFSPSTSLILSAMARPTIEVLPPGANGMTSVTARVG